MMSLADLDDVDYFEEDEDVRSVWDDDDLHSPPLQQEFSLLDLATATQSRQHQKRGRKSCKAAKDAETAMVNSASNQRIKKYGKGTAVFIESEEETEVEEETDDDLDLTRTMSSETDTDDDDSGLQSADEELDNISLEVPSATVIDYEKEFAKLDDSFCSCEIPGSEFNVCFLRETFRSAVEFGKCSPFTVRFDMRAVSSVLNVDMKEVKDANPADWWLTCQVGDRQLWQVDSTESTHQAAVMVK